MIFFVIATADQSYDRKGRSHEPCTIYDQNGKEITTAENLDRNQITNSIATATGIENASYEIIDSTTTPKPPPT